MKLIIKICCILICFQIYIATTNKCFQDLTLSHTEQQVIEEVQKLIEQQNKIEFECLQILINRGFYKAALELYESYFMVEKINIVEQVRLLTNDVKKKILKWSSSMELANAQIQKLRPVLQWAQSRDFVFIYLKKALRKDAPGCIECSKNEKIQIFDDRVQTTSFGVISHQPIQWTLDLELQGKIDPEKSFWQEQGVGVQFFNLTKVENGTLWEGLEKNVTKQPQIWWDMRDKYKKDMDDWMKMVEGEQTEQSEQEQADGEDGEGNSVLKQKNQQNTNNDTQQNKKQDKKKSRQSRKAEKKNKDQIKEDNSNNNDQSQQNKDKSEQKIDL